MIPDNLPPPAHDDGPPQGNLENLFRHHLADAEVTPQPLVWKQLDNALLVRQNEAYRRRLVATRWVAAAGLLLATLAGADWWARQTPAAPNVAFDQPAGPASRTDWPHTSGTSGGAVGQAGNRPGSTPRGAAPVASTSISGYPHSVPLLATTASKAAAGRGAAPVLALLAAVPAASARRGTAGPVGFSGLSNGIRQDSAALALGPAALRSGAHTYTYSSNGADAIDSGTIAATTPADATRAKPPALVVPSAGSPGAFGEAWGLLALRSTTLANSQLMRPLPASLTAVAAALNVEAAPLRRWQFGAGYAAGVFYPNADFSRESGLVATAGAYYSPAGASSVALTNRSATEYRNYLRGGLDQRLSLRASRLLGGRWALSTGLELGQHEAQSATSTSFVGEQLAAYLPPSPTLRTTSFRYRTAGLPVEVRYANPVKRGWGTYGRVGAVVSALLSVRSEVADRPEATKTYSLAATGSPYRRLLTTLRGGAGVQYRADAGSWTLSVGPTAELGVLSLNAQPVQDFVHQRRPYSVGLEAAVDFGGTVKMP